MDRFDDMDKAFGLGTIFGIGITTVTVGVSMCVRIAKSKNRIKKAVARKRWQDCFRKLMNP